jgi:transcriptional regulator with XRE-family HTH domain
VRRARRVRRAGKAKTEPEGEMEKSGVSKERPAARQAPSARKAGVRLRMLRRWCGASQRDLARVSGVSTYRIRRYESGLALPGAEEVLRLSRALRDGKSYLAGGEAPTAAEAAEMRVQWKLGQVPPPLAAAVLTLAEGLLSTWPHRRPEKESGS